MGHNTRFRMSCEGSHLGWIRHLFCAPGGRPTDSSIPSHLSPGNSWGPRGVWGAWGRSRTLGTKSLETERQSHYCIWLFAAFFRYKIIYSIGGVFLSNTVYENCSFLMVNLIYSNGLVVFPVWGQNRFSAAGYLKIDGFKAAVWSLTRN